ncbi:hypothetical protein [Paenibacillus sp. MMS18-CY102]|uniref:hypothetical protein n=1 Tax=Paenibacillus sp. MMS18-CY102 TaxID=2682849 RepID=UPI0013663179|nr:hypothetical protein [Paenibacillus sp. MMS18-CY102]MWC30938.1 hypothetical protein [Paenibacillus sp. MMS18-CY102]
MKESILVKLLSAFISMFLMSFLCVIVFFPDEIIGMVLFGAIMFCFLYLLGGIPVSLIISKYINPNRRTLWNTCSYVFVHMLGGLVVTIIFMFVSEPDHSIEMFVSEDMMSFYGIGAMSGLVFSLIELITLKLRRKSY